MREHKLRDLGAQRGSGAQNIHATIVSGDVDNNKLTEELRLCKHFLVDSEMDNGRPRVFTFPMDTGSEIFVAKFGSCFWQPQMCSQVEYSLRVCALKRIRWKLSALLCIRK